MWIRRLRRSCIFTPTPKRWVLPIITRISPAFTFAKMSALALSVIPSCITIICSAGTPRAISFSRISSNRLKPTTRFSSSVVSNLRNLSAKIATVPRSFFVSSRDWSVRSTAALVLLPGSSIAFELTKRVSIAAAEARPNIVRGMWLFFFFSAPDIFSNSSSFAFTAFIILTNEGVCSRNISWSASSPCSSSRLGRLISVSFANTVSAMLAQARANSGSPWYPAKRVCSLNWPFVLNSKRCSILPKLCTKSSK